MHPAKTRRLIDSPKTAAAIRVVATASKLDRREAPSPPASLGGKRSG